MTFAKLATHFWPPINTSSPSIYSLDIPADGEVADEMMTVRIPVIKHAICSGRVLAPTVAEPRPCMT